MPIISGTTYRFTNAQFPGKALNVYAANTISARRNVCLYDDTPTDVMQQWVVSGNESVGYNFRCTANQNYGLRYSYGETDPASCAGNADVEHWSNMGSADFLHEIEYLGNNQVRIKNRYTGTYLTAYSNANGNSNSITNVETTGNVYWSNNSALGNRQVWNISPSIDEENTTGESDLTEGYYRITINSSTKKALNHYGAGNGTTANLYACDGTADQVWKLEANKLYCESRSGYGLKANGTSVIVSQTPDIIEFSNTGTHLYTIKLTGTNYYLVENNGQVVWQSTSSPTSWRVERIIKQTGIPNKGTEYFSTDSGFIDGIWNSSYSNMVRNFYKKVYDVSAVDDANCFYNLYGALMVNSGCFHCGIDMKLYDGAPIKAPFSGKVTRISENYGRVYLYNQTLDATFVFLHMAISQNLSKDDVISEGTIIGTQSGYGKNSLPNDFGSHLHVEIHTGEHTGGASVAPEYSYSQLGNSVEPYSYLGAV